MHPQEMSSGAVVQIDPAHDEMFGGCLMVVSDPRSWGLQGYVKIPGQGDAFYRAPFDAIEFIGIAAWVRPLEEGVE